MSRGKSGRIVLEIDPDIKRTLYLVLEIHQLTLKEWFLETANNYISTNPISRIRAKNKPRTSSKEKQ